MLTQGTEGLLLLFMAFIVFFFFLFIYVFIHAETVRSLRAAFVLSPPSVHFYQPLGATQISDSFRLALEIFH